MDKKRISSTISKILMHTFNPWYFRIMKIKSKLNSDVQLFQYQQNELSPLTLTHWTQKWNNEIWCWKSISLLGIAIQMWWVLHRLMGYQSFPLDTCISSDNVYIKKRYKKIPTRFASTQKDHILSQRWMTTNTWTLPGTMNNHS